MRVQTTLPVLWRESLKACANGIGAPGKSSDSASLGKDTHTPPRDARRQRPPLQVELVCQDDTKARDPFWDSPRLSPAFVTQLLGQVMAGERNIAPRRVYGTSETGAAAIFDARV